MLTLVVAFTLGTGRVSPVAPFAQECQTTFMLGATGQCF